MVVPEIAVTADSTVTGRSSSSRRRLSLVEILSEVPILSLTEESAFHRHSPNRRRISLLEALTDIELMESDSSRRSSFQPDQPNPRKFSATDVENYDDSNSSFSDDQSDDDKYDENIELDEMLDQGYIESSVKITENEEDKDASLQNTQTTQKLMNLFVTDIANVGTTDCEDMAGSEHDLEVDDKVRYEDVAIHLDDGGCILIQDSVRKQPAKVEKAVAKARPTPESSDSEEEQEKAVKPHHYHHRKGHKKEAPKSDVEYVDVTGDESNRRNSACVPLARIPCPSEPRRKSILKMTAPDSIPAINITCEQSPTHVPAKKSTKKCMLIVEDNDGGGVTDVENLNTSDDDDEPVCGVPIPKASFKARNIEGYTDVEDILATDEEDSDGNDLFVATNRDILLPSPTRELIIISNDETGQPNTTVMPLDDTQMLGLTDYRDGGLTDNEDFSGAESGDEEEMYDISKYTIDSMPEFSDGGVLSAHESAVKSRLTIIVDTGMTEPKTETEDLCVEKAEPKRRRTKTRHTQSKSKKYLDINTQQDDKSDKTDVEDLEMTDDEPQPSTSTALSIPSNLYEGGTDIEVVSADDDFEIAVYEPQHRASLSQMDSENCCAYVTTRESLGPDCVTSRQHSEQIQIPLIREICATPDVTAASQTEYEDVSDDGTNLTEYNRRSSTPYELCQALDEACSSTVHDESVNTRQKGCTEIKGHKELVEQATDVEVFDDDGIEDMASDDELGACAKAIVEQLTDVEDINDSLESDQDHTQIELNVDPNGRVMQLSRTTKNRKKKSLKTKQLKKKTK